MKMKGWYKFLVILCGVSIVCSHYLHSSQQTVSKGRINLYMIIYVIEQRRIVNSTNTNTNTNTNKVTNKEYLFLIRRKVNNQHLH